MRALRWYAAGDLRLEEVPDPVPRPGMAIVSVGYCGICGSDLAEYRSGPVMISPSRHPLSGHAPPVTLGHEIAGRVGAKRVTVDACWRCGRCEACVNGNYNRCRYGGSIGLHSDGAFAPLVQVPEYMLVELPDGVGDEAAALTEPFAVALHCLDRAGARAADDVLILGFGPIGSAAAMCARAIGARPWVVEPHYGRRTQAETLGFRTLDAGDDLPRRLRPALGAGGAEVVIESTGTPAIVPIAIECARRGGRIVLVGLSDAPSSVSAARLVLFERSLIGSLGYRHDLPRVTQMMADRRIEPEALIGAVAPLSTLAATISDMAERPGDAIKVLVDPRR